MSRIVVGPAGQTPNDIMICGEAPGREEASRGVPFVGESGRWQQIYLRRPGVEVRKTYRTNVVKEYRQGNPDPTPEQIEEWTPVLLGEIERCSPKIVIAVGRFAARWFLQKNIRMEQVHGMPHLAHESRGGMCVVPVYHPAWGLRNTDARGLIAWDYGRAVDIYNGIVGGVAPRYAVDKFAGKEQYGDVTGAQLKSFLGHRRPDRLAIDTEGVPSKPWSIQVTTDEGMAKVLRCTQPYFGEGIAELQRVIDAGCLVITHNASTPMGCAYDVWMAEVMGLDLSRATIRDTMFYAYLLRVEPQGLKDLAFRSCGMSMSNYMSIVSGAASTKQLNYLLEVAARDWPKPPSSVVTAGNGVSKLYSPKSATSRAKTILKDYDKSRLMGDDTVDDETMIRLMTLHDENGWDWSDDATVYDDYEDRPKVDLFARWKAVDESVRRSVEGELGPMPEATLDDVPLEDAVRYAGADSDATFRSEPVLWQRLQELGYGATDMAIEGSYLLNAFYEMQRTGMPASRSHFKELYEQTTDSMYVIQSRISHKFADDVPFNPKSTQQVAAVMSKLGLKGKQLTKSGAMSTSKASIEHLRGSSEFIDLVFQYRENQHVRDSFCVSALESVGEGDGDIGFVHCVLKTTRTTSRRLASTKPNLLAIPTRGKLGKMVRRGYKCPEGYSLGAWDYSAMEMVVMADASHDPVMCKMFREGRDIHSETAAMIFGVSLDTVLANKDRYRTPTKTVGFGILYGIQPPGLSTQLRMMGLEGWGLVECEKLIEDWLDVYKGVARYIKRVEREIIATGLARDRWGMVRYLPGIDSPEEFDRMEAVRLAVSQKIQGGAQGAIRQAMMNLHPYVLGWRDAGMDIRWCLQVHDEIILLFKDDLWDIINPVVADVMQNQCGYKPCVPMRVSGNVAKSWGELK